jgi:hypothetical protein
MQRREDGNSMDKQIKAECNKICKEILELKKQLDEIHNKKSKTENK